VLKDFDAEPRAYTGRQCFQVSALQQGSASARVILMGKINLHLSSGIYSGDLLTYVAGFILEYYGER
jgi:hypothetical protein